MRLGLDVQDRKPREIGIWLRSKPSLEELREAFPAEWEAVQRDLADALPRTDVAELKDYLSSLTVDPLPRRGLSPRRLERLERQAVRAEARRLMTIAALEQLSLAAVAGVPSGGRIRFNLLNGFVAQRLLFEQDLKRKPVSMPWFRLWWPLLWQRRFLMPLVGPKGIYCFYSKPLIGALAELAEGRSCLEIAAGDGTLSRFLRDVGVEVVAIDDYSWEHSVRYSEDVLRADARRALRERQPEVVICSWPPADNSFERHVFSTPSVDTYIVISSRHRFASGNWDDYEQQTGFAFCEEPELSRLVLPPELQSAVYVFRRKDPLRQ